jgi:hypothetical protein
MIERSSDAVATIFVRKEERSRGKTERRGDGETGRRRKMERASFKVVERDKEKAEKVSN